MLSNRSLYSGYLTDMETIKNAQPKCLKVQCRIICFNGKESEIANDISIALSESEKVSIRLKGQS